MKEEGGDVTWREVFSRDRDHAKSLGARKMLHVGSLDERVKEYLIRDEERLGKR